MATIAQIVASIRTAIYGKDVRSSIAEGIEKCYTDVTNGVTLATTAAAAANSAASTGNSINTQLTNNANALIKVQATQPTEPFNKIWVQPTSDEYQVPTWEEHQALEGDISDLENELNEIRSGGGPNLYNKDTNTIGKNISSTGVIDDSTLFDISDYIYCPKGKYIIRAFAITGTPNYTVSIYNTSKVFQNRDVSVAANYPNGVTYNFSVDRYVRLTVPTAGKPNQLGKLVFMPGESVESYVPYYIAKDDIAREQTEVIRSEMIPSLYNIKFGTVKDSAISSSTGAFYPETGWDRTDYIDCSKCREILYYTETRSDYNAFYNASKEKISTFVMFAGKLNNNYRTVDVPVNAVYFALSNTASALAKTRVFPISEAALIQRLNIFTGEIVTASSADITVETQGTSLLVKFPSVFYVEYTTYSGALREKQFTGSPSFTVEANKYLVANIGTSAISIMSFAEIQALSAEIPIVVMLYNNYGYPIGIMNQYYKQDMMPSYYDSYMKTKTDTINSIKSGVGLKGFSFVFITDQHHQQNQMQSPKLIKYIRENTNIDLIINGGDFYTYDSSKEDAYRDISTFVDQMKSISGCRMISVVGNHEFNNPNASSSQEAMAKTLSLDEVASVFYTGEDYEGCVFDKNNLSFYKDFDDLRVFFMPCNYASGLYLNPVKWILKQFEFIPAGYKVMLVSHVIVEWQQNISAATMLARMQALANGFDALKAKTTYTYDNTAYDYTGTNTIPVCIIGGHTHIDHDMVTTGGIPVIITTCDANQQESGGLTRTAYTTNEQAFDVVTIDYTNRTINCTRIGAGQDREFNF